MSDYAWKPYLDRGEPRGLFDDGNIPTKHNSENMVTQEQRSRAVRAVAANAIDAIECAELLEMLGLHASEGKRVTEDR